MRVRTLIGCGAWRGREVPAEPFASTSAAHERLVPSVPLSSFVTPVSWFSVRLPFLLDSPQVRGLYRSLGTCVDVPVPYSDPPGSQCPG